MPVFLLSAGVIGAPLALKGRAVDDHAPVAAVFGPGVSTTEALRRVIDAGGLPLRAGAFGNVIVARSDKEGFLSALHRQGAWLLLDPVFAGCADIQR
ncbi:hypothetical protein [Azospirillum sp.]|uniref:hypothetical protein n=1 Tax=Azospirillum sp. TaxID=34012 RepID=UPI002D2CE2A5|nr:hypothetical protein [Azospirillum sp.]HYD65734.1 hypothetical protein [Azospirillum sp.]